MDLKLSKQDHARIYRVYEDLMGVDLQFDNDWEKARKGDVHALADFQRLEDGLKRHNRLNGFNHAAHEQEASIFSTAVPDFYKELGKQYRKGEPVNLTEAMGKLKGGSGVGKMVAVGAVAAAAGVLGYWALNRRNEEINNGQQSPLDAMSPQERARFEQMKSELQTQSRGMTTDRSPSR